MSGRKPKPHALKKAQGNPGKRKLLNAPNFKGKFGSPPKWMQKEARSLWKTLAIELEGQGLGAPAYQTALEALCVNYGRAIQAEAVLKKEKLTFVTEAGYVGQHPAVNISIKSWSMVVKVCVEFGLTPSAVGRLDLSPEKVQSLEELVS